jgi:hypothetical protein
MFSGSATQLSYRREGFLYRCLCNRYRGEVFTLPLSSSDHVFWLCYTAQLPKDSSIGACAIITVERYLLYCCLAATVSSGSTILAFIFHVTIWCSQTRLTWTMTAVGKYNCQCAQWCLHYILPSALHIFLLFFQSPTSHMPGYVTLFRPQLLSSESFPVKLNYQNVLSFPMYVNWSSWSRQEHFLLVFRRCPVVLLLRKLTALTVFLGDFTSGRSSRVPYDFCHIYVVWWAELLAAVPEVWVRFLTLPDFLRNSGSGTGSTQSREYSWGATRKMKAAAPVQKSEITALGDPLHWLSDAPPSAKVGSNFADKRRSLGRYSLLRPRSFFFFNGIIN